MRQHPFVQIPELGRMNSGHGLVRIPPEQDVPFTPRVRALVDTPEFRRLAGISQLGLVAQVYPGATHTRFEHALGVFHNSLRYLWQLGKDSRFTQVVDERAAELLMVCALLHDLGHWPLCHPIEDLELPGQPTHEQYAATYLAAGTGLYDMLRNEWNIDPAAVLDVLAPRSHSTRMSLLRSIISGPVDIDKLDYLERDSLHCGVPYGRNFDKNRLIQSLIVNEAGDALALTSKGKTAAEMMVFARYVMFSEVYWHHGVRSATAMFSRAFYELRGSLDLGAMLRASESAMTQQIRQHSMGTDWEPLTAGVFGPRRRLFKRVFEGSSLVNRELYGRLAGRPYCDLVRVSSELAARFTAKLGRPVPAAAILIDAPPRHREVETNVDLFDAKHERYTALKDLSPVVRALAATQFDDYVKRVRLYAAPDLQPELRRQAWLSNEIDAACTAVLGS